MRLWKRKVYPRRSQNGPPSINVQNLASIICWKSSENKATEYQKIHALCFRRLRQLIVSVNGGYYYFGLLSGITKTVSLHPNHFEEKNLVKLSINIDGVPLFKSSSVQFWPILCSAIVLSPSF